MITCQCESNTSYCYEEKEVISKMRHSQSCDLHGQAKKGEVVELRMRVNNLEADNALLNTELREFIKALSKASREDGSESAYNFFMAKRKQYSMEQSK